MKIFKRIIADFSSRIGQSVNELKTVIQFEKLVKRKRRKAISNFGALKQSMSSTIMGLRWLLEDWWLQISTLS
ncbi:hypothetical protein MA16_Dca026756 [Dendrobium catenatum]|uniref:Uncharacterized protein n=1 Tax=Dendrobium catenatum TaxID=906689 RepID=A0A2I0V918_9ASPA|nr:hypothetical protein MA16_Dca026756 [Dendrobium catenatum]